MRNYGELGIHMRAMLPPWWMHLIIVSVSALFGLATYNAASSWRQANLQAGSVRIPMVNVAPPKRGTVSYQDLAPALESYALAAYRTELKDALGPAADGLGSDFWTSIGNKALNDSADHEIPMVGKITLKGESDLLKRALPRAVLALNITSENTKSIQDQGLINQMFTSVLVDQSVQLADRIIAAAESDASNIQSALQKASKAKDP